MANVAINADGANIPAVNLTQQGSDPSAPGAGKTLLYADTSGNVKARPTGGAAVALGTATPPVGLSYVIDGGGTVITTGLKGYVQMPFAMTLQSYGAAGTPSGSVTLDIWKTTHALFDGTTHPVAGDTICGTTPITYNGTVKASGTIPGDWTTALSMGDWLAYNVNGCGTVQMLTIALHGVRG